MEKTTREYSPPELTVHGGIEEITHASNMPNSDVQIGTAGTAYPVIT